MFQNYLNLRRVHRLVHSVVQSIGMPSEFDFEQSMSNFDAGMEQLNFNHDERQLAVLYLFMQPRIRALYKNLDVDSILIDFTQVKRLPIGMLGVVGIENVHDNCVGIVNFVFSPDHAGVKLIRAHNAI